MSPDDIRGWLKVRECSGIGDVTLRRLMELFESPKAAMAASRSDLLAIRGLGEEDIEHITRCLDDPMADDEFDQALQLGCSVVTICDVNYPSRLKAIHDAPPILYMLGTFEDADDYAIAIVGTRRSTSYGHVVTQQLSAGLSRNGFTIVSGLARGIDGWAHRAALDAGGRTMAVLGCGIDVTYPHEHNQLKRAIVEKGVVMSEFPLGTVPRSVHFPKRNRIISGLALGAVVVEATVRSGSLITARLALEQGREVFAVPGRVGNQSSEGTNQLIQQGAKLVGRVEDIIDELRPQLDAAFDEMCFRQSPTMPVLGEKVVPAELSGDAITLYKLLESGQMHIDSLVQESRLHVSTVAGRLIEMELKGLVEQRVGQWYRRIR